MSTDWSGIILDSQSPKTLGRRFLSNACTVEVSSSPVALHDATVIRIDC
jgi:hypothetical protein